MNYSDQVLLHPRCSTVTCSGTAYILNTLVTFTSVKTRATLTAVVSDTNNKKKIGPSALVVGVLTGDLWALRGKNETKNFWAILCFRSTHETWPESKKVLQVLCNLVTHNNSCGLWSYGNDWCGRLAIQLKISLAMHLTRILLCSPFFSWKCFVAMGTTQMTWTPTICWFVFKKRKS